MLFGKNELRNPDSREPSRDAGYLDMMNLEFIGAAVVHFSSGTCDRCCYLVTLFMA